MDVNVDTRWDKPNNRFSFNLNENRRVVNLSPFNKISARKGGKKMDRKKIQSRSRFFIRSQTWEMRNESWT